MQSSSAPVKPLLRGHFHQAAFFLAFGACSVLLAFCKDSATFYPVLVYSIALNALFAISAIYHRPNWSPEKRQWMRKLDHAAIYVLIGGTGTPICFLAMANEPGSKLNLILWSAVAVGVVQSLFWVHAPKWVSVLCYLVAACLSVPYIPEFTRSEAVGSTGLLLLLAGGFFFLLGGIIYALKKPNPIPHIFGHHEIFHILVVIGTAFHFAVIFRILRLKNLVGLFWVAVIFGSFAQTALAATTPVPFAYSVRLRDYNGYDSKVRGDINTVGMGGATVAIPHNISAVELNPAGFAMTTSGLSAQINNNTIHDSQIQQSGETFENNQWGLGVSPSPWGFGFAYYTPKSESGTYITPNTGQIYPAEVSVKEFRLSAARSFLNNRLSLGLSVSLLKARRHLGPYRYDASSYAFHTGALYRLPKNFVLGLTFTPQTTIDPSSDPDQTDLPGFNKAITHPALMGLGLGWIPNRFFRAGFGLQFVGLTKNTSLLSDQDKEIGRYITCQPRLGASYVIADYHNFKIEYSLGTYYEPSRIPNVANRTHATMGLEINPWFINTGAGFDVASGYRNIMVAIGVDIVRTLRSLDIIPEERVPHHNGFFPNPHDYNSSGLPESFSKDDPNAIAAPNVEEVKSIFEHATKKIDEKLHKSNSKKNKTYIKEDLEN